MNTENRPCPFRLTFLMICTFCVCVQDKMVFLCSVDCSHEFKKANNVTSVCEYCMIEKITRDVKRVNNKDCYFCSDGKESWKSIRQL